MGTSFEAKSYRSDGTFSVVVLFADERREHSRMKPILIHVPHASMYIPEEYRKTALISQEELEDENHFMCDTGVLELIPPAFANNTVVFPYSRLYCDVERFRDGSEPMEAYGMGFIYTSDSRGREMFCPTTEHRKSVSAIYDRHHSRLNRRTTEILKEHERCLIIDLHSFSDETVNRLFGWTDFPDVCIGTEPDYYSEELVKSICCFCRNLGLTVALNYPYQGSLVPNQYYGKKNTGIISVMLEINKRVLNNKKSLFR